jgi:hypothetical protein
MNEVLILRTCNADMTSYGGFKWPGSGPVEAPDWKPNQECGNGLHGFLWGEGDGSLANWKPDAKWLVVKVKEAEIIDLSGKVKFRRGEVVDIPKDRASATKYIHDHGGASKAIIGFNASTTGNGAHASTTGNGANASTTGNGANASTTGNGANASTTGNGAHASTTGNGAHASTTGYGAHASTTGNNSHASTTGNWSIAVAIGWESAAAASESGAIVLSYFDGIRPRIVALYPGENGIKPHTFYRLKPNGSVIELGPNPAANPSQNKETQS